MASKQTTSRFKPLSEIERRIGNRLAYIRRQRDHTQFALASQLRLTRNQLSNIESGRVPLKADKGWQACRIYEVRPAWLASGVPPEGPFPELESGFEQWADEHFSRAKSLSFGDAWASIGWLFADTPDMEEYRQKILPQLEKHLADQESENKPLTYTPASEKTGLVKPLLPRLLCDLKQATREYGAAAALAKDMGVSKETVSRWLSGKMEPSGEVTLQLLEWVKRQGA